MKVEKFDVFNKINESIEDEKPNYTLVIEVNFSSDKDKEDAKSAIKKGIYWGLDTKRISSPKGVKINFI